MVEHGDYRSTIEDHFRHENVWVSIPEQPDGRGLKIVQREVPERWDLPPDDESFKLSRRVINFEVHDENGEVVKDFAEDAPMELRVGLTLLEVQRQKKDQSVRLAYTAEIGGRLSWVPLDDLQFDLDARDVVVQIRHWGDPTLGLGRR